MAKIETDYSATAEELEQKKQNRLAFLICPPMSANDHGEFQRCRVEECAWWNSDRECCGMLPYKEVRISGYIDNHSY